MVTDRIYLLPLIIFVLLPATFIISYIISVCLGHVSPEFPYISDTGTYSPESCLFGQLLNIAAVLVAITVYIRYKQVYIYCGDRLAGETIPRINRSSLVFGLLLALGISVVANFQETNVIVVHLAGALTTFGAGTAYLWLQTTLSYLVCPTMNTRRTAHVRLALSVVSTVAFLTSGIAGPIAMARFNGKEKTKWLPENDGFAYHVVSAAAEWILAMAFDTFILTFVHEFKRIAIASPQVFLTIQDVRLLVPADGPGEGSDDASRGSLPFRELLA